MPCNFLLGITVYLKKTITNLPNRNRDLRSAAWLSSGIVWFALISSFQFSIHRIRSLSFIWQLWYRVIPEARVLWYILVSIKTNIHQTNSCWCLTRLRFVPGSSIIYKLKIRRDSLLSYNTMILYTSCFQNKNDVRKISFHSYINFGALALQ